jgi:pimeloyl-ACP methyl ester carboxylesterase
VLAGDDTGGGGDGPPIVLLHGLTFDRRTCAPVVDAYQSLDRDRRLVTLDLPGHGESAPHPPHDLPAIAEIVHEALAVARVEEPVMVGHSMSGGLVSIYGARFPVAGIVAVDQSLVIQPFAELIRSIETQLRGPDFDQVWPMFFRSFRTDLLPPAARELVESTCNPRQDIVVSYWSMLLDHPIEEIVDLIAEVAERIVGAHVSYVYVAGDEPPETVSSWMHERIPHAQTIVWEDSGHFPHLAHPDRFAALLDSTANWRSA